MRNQVYLHASLPLSPHCYHYWLSVPFYPPFFSTQLFVLICSLGHICIHGITSLSLATGVFCFFPQPSSEASAISLSTLPSFMLGTLTALVFGSHLVDSPKLAPTPQWATQDCRGYPWPGS